MPPRTYKRERDGAKQVWICLDFRRDETEKYKQLKIGALIFKSRLRREQDEKNMEVNNNEINNNNM